MLSKRPWMVIHQFALTRNFASSFPGTCLAFRLRWWTFIWLLRVLFHKIQVWWLENSRFHHFRNWLQMHFLKFPVSKSAKSILQCHIEPKCRPQHNWFWLILEHRSKMIISTNCHPKNSKINYRNDQFLSECTHCQWNSIYAPWVMILWNFDVMRTFAVSNVCKYSNHRRIFNDGSYRYHTGLSAWDRLDAQTFGKIISKSVSDCEWVEMTLFVRFSFSFPNVCKLQRMPGLFINRK